MIRRGDCWGFSSAEFIKKGDHLIGERLAEELVETVDRIDAPTRTVAVQIPGANTFSAEGVWVYNDLPAEAGTSGVAEATAQSSGPGSASGTGITTASGSGSTSGSASSSGSSSSGSGSKSSGSSLSSSGSGSGSRSRSSGGGTGTYTI